MGLDEEVLVVPRRRWVECGGRVGFGPAVGVFERLLDPDHLAWMSRRLCETDEDWLQLVPYVVVTAPDPDSTAAGPLVFCYRRGSSGNETRLHARWSLGVGGHVGRDDGPAGPAAYFAGFHRELHEEVELFGRPFTEKVVGLIHDPGTPVGRVHLGVVHLLTLPAPEAVARDRSLVDAGFHPSANALADREQFESWSALVLDHVLAPAAESRNSTFSE
ncbi:MAG: phosphoesterase [Planctomycetia bacterium]